MASFLAFLIAVVQVAGPLLCCCAPVTVTPVVAHQPAEESARPHCCTPKQTDDGTPAKPCSPDECCVTSHIPLAIPVAESLDWQQFALSGGDWFTPTLIAVLFSAPTIDPSPWRQSMSHDPFLTTSARLYAHHALRC